MRLLILYTHILISLVRAVQLQTLASEEKGRERCEGAPGRYSKNLIIFLRVSGLRDCITRNFNSGCSEKFGYLLCISILHSYDFPMCLLLCICGCNYDSGGLGV